ncbi:MAG: hypothetical protein CL565_00410 [Alphaproteobacteria bacterium]|nr:hypothetical protein [Alphaproteobacteria bacterium]|tara:strand:- start:1415 stop:1657 length:243 start_codon:yes stop_codon:yes gene_type:complete
MFKRFKKETKSNNDSRAFAKSVGGDNAILVDFNTLCITAYLSDIADQKTMHVPPPPPLRIQKLEFKPSLDKIDFSGKTIH